MGISLSRPCGRAPVAQDRASFADPDARDAVLPLVAAGHLSPVDVVQLAGASRQLRRALAPERQRLAIPAHLHLTARSALARMLPTLPNMAAVAAAAEVAAAIPPGYAFIPAGPVVLGSPEDEAGRFEDESEVLAHIKRPYLLKADKLTQQEYEELMGYNPSHFTANPPGGGTAAQCPVERVDFYHALACLNALSAREGLRPCYDLGGWTGRADAGAYAGTPNVPWDETANGYRLPTVAEWVRAARAGTTGATYAEGQGLDAIACHAGNSGGRTRPVGQELPNAWGVRPYGNVFVWAWDWYGVQQAGGNDPKGPATGSYRVFVGGSWLSGVRGVRAAFRDYAVPTGRRDGLGLSPARSLFP